MEATDLIQKALKKHKRRVIFRNCFLATAAVLFAFVYIRMLYPATAMSDSDTTETTTVVESTAASNESAGESGSISGQSAGDSDAVVTSVSISKTTVSLEGLLYTFDMNTDGTYTMTVTVEDSSLTTAAIPDGLMSMEPFSEYANSVTEVVFDIQDVDTFAIGDKAFYDCTKITAVSFSDDYNAQHLSIGSYAFYGCTGLTEISIPSGLYELGEGAFMSCTALESISFGRTEYDETGTYNLTISTHAFCNCDVLKTLDLTPLQNLVTIEAGIYAGCVGLQSVKLPGNLTTLETYGLGESDADKSSYGVLSSLTSITFEENDKLTAMPPNPFRHCTALKTLDLSPLNAWTTHSASYLLATTSVNTLTLPSSLTSISGDLSCSSLRNILFEEESQLEELGAWTLRSSSIAVLDLSGLKNLTRLGEGILRTVKTTTTVILPESLTTIGKAFVGCPSIRYFTLNSANLTSCSSDAFADYSDTYPGPTDMVVTIGASVDSVTGDFFAAASGRVSTFIFEGENEFTVTDTVSTGLSGALDTLGGSYYVSSDGDLYQLNEDQTATLIYKAPDADGVFVLPATVGLADDYTVTGIGDYAFVGSGVTALTFDNVEKIKELDANAFVNGTSLASIAGKTTVSDVVNYFAAYSISTEGSFYNNTALTGAALTGVTADLSNASEETDGTIAVGSYEVSTSYSELLTGEQASVMVRVNDGGSEDILRLYLQWEDGCEYTDSLTSINQVPVKFVKLDENIGYYEIGPWEGSAGSTDYFNLYFKYPNNSGSGLHLNVWAVSGSAESFPSGAIDPATAADGLNISDTYFDITWNTNTYSHPVSKTNTGHYSLVLTEDNKSAIAGLAYTICLNDAQVDEAVAEYDPGAGKLGAQTSFGSNYVTYAEFTDRLTLPEELVLRDGIAAAIAAGNYRMESGTNAYSVYVAVDGVEYLLLTLNQTVSSGVNFTVSNVKFSVVDASVDGDDTTTADSINVSWVCTNGLTDKEIQNCGVTLTYGSDVILYAGTGGDDVTLDTANTVNVTEHYTYGTDTASSQAFDNGLAISGTGSVELTKTVSDTSVYFGEDVTYTITATNSTPYIYSELYRINDCLDKSACYIRPENIVKMFQEVPEGQTLKLTIFNARSVLTNSQISALTDADLASPTATEVSAVNGSTGSYTSWQNTAGVEDYSVKYTYSSTSTETYDGTEMVVLANNSTFNSTITIQMEDGKLKIGIVGMVFTVDGTAEALSNALDALGYYVGYNTQFDVNYYLGDGLAGGETVTYNIYATYKDSFMRTSRDVLRNFAYPSGFNSTYSNGNVVAAYNSSGEKLDSAQSATVIAMPDIQILKNSNANDKVENGSVQEYMVKLTHMGTGTFDVLPVVDYMTGAQAMLVSVEENKDAAWAAGLATYTYNGKAYYILMPTDGDSCTFEGVVMGGMYADSVTVELTRDQSGKVTDITTTTHWYLLDTFANNFCRNFKYNVLVDLKLLGFSSATTSFSLFNEVYVGDNPTHRYYYFVSLDGAVLDVSKQIVTGMDEDGNETTADHSAIKQDNRSVTYQIELSNASEVTKTITGQMLHDELPDITLEAAGYGFEWVKNENVSLYYILGEGVTVTYDGQTVEGDGETAVKFGGKEWSITYTDPKTANTQTRTQYIVWSEDISLSFEQNSAMYIYITLEYPGKTTQEWNDYLTAWTSYGVLYLENSFYCETQYDSVTHELVNPTEGYLQKGVYEVGYYRRASTSAYGAYFRTDDRTVYTNTIDNLNGLKSSGADVPDLAEYSVAYYIVLQNTGDSKLYVNTIYDSLPRGFEFYTLRTISTYTESRTVGYLSAAYRYSIDYNTGYLLASPAADFSEKWVDSTALSWYSEGDNKMTITAAVTTDEQSGQQIVAFDVAGGFLDNQKDEYGSYLEPGQYIVIGYECLVGYEAETEDVAANTVAMMVTDIHGAGVVLDTDTEVTVSAKANTSAIYNDGNRTVHDNDDVESLISGDVTAELDENTMWLTSAVSLSRATVVEPDISKKVSGTKEQDFVSYDENVTWTVTASNDGDAYLSNYVIQDTIELPQYFVGTVTFEVYTNDTVVTNNATQILSRASYNSQPYMLTIERNYGDDYVTVYAYSNQQKAYQVYLNDAVQGQDQWVECAISYGVSSAFTHKKIYIAMEQDTAAGTETLQIRFEDEACSIPPNGYVVMTYQTRNISGSYESDPALYNTAMLLPQETTEGYSYDETEAQLVKNGDTVIGVLDRAYISTDVTYPTSSVLSVSASGGTVSSVDNAYSLVLADRDENFTYTLSVTTGDQQIHKLVLIDNLPEYGDTATMSSYERNSEFDVVLAEDPNFVVTVTYEGEDGETVTKTLTLGTEFTVYYSTKTSFSDEDWDGGNTGWTEWTGNESAETIADIRSVRLVIDDGIRVVNGSVTDTSEYGYTIPANATVSFSFNAAADNTATGNAAAEAGEVALNSFGYQYMLTVEENNKTLAYTLYAAPLEVGVTVPATPSITKNIVDSDGNAVQLLQDETLSFIIYQGAALSFDNYSLETVCDTLQENEICFTYVQLVVKEGESCYQITNADGSVSYSHSLDDLMTYCGYSAEDGFESVMNDGTAVEWTWDYEVSTSGSGAITGSTYTVVELENRHFEDVHWNSTAGRQYTFTYDPMKQLTLTCTNEWMGWEIVVNKTDQSEIPLTGAVFGLYSCEASDAMTEAEVSEYAVQYGIEIEKTMVFEDQTYYLCSIAVSQKGLIDWTGLRADSYVVIELKSPDGYSMAVDVVPAKCSCDFAETEAQTIILTVINESGVELPMTGGTGAEAYAIIGALLMLLAAALLLTRKRYCGK